jgi:AraC family transcriptional regulator
MMELLIKNMVCDRCIRTVRDELEKSGSEVTDITLGKAVLSSDPNDMDLDDIRKRLLENGFELIENKRAALVDQVKNLIIEEIQHLKGQKPASMNYSEYIAQQTGHEYPYVSQLFSAETNLTIEQFIIAQRIEKVKEWLSYNELSVSEIAWQLGYSSVAHLSNQFKKITGMTPAAYKKSEVHPRLALDKVGKK